ncbi:MAG: glutathione S-transferase family protein [Alphaproteobacteria bacterium]|nr:glutathione S-transferase family protein [Alphaproteobacteria bacterium]
MKLIGGFGSPYVRRVAASLNFLGLDWDHEAVSVFENPDAVSKHNPVVRVPTVVLDDGEALFESFAILDALDDIAGDAKRLIPANGAARRSVMRLVATACGAMDKAVTAYYEGRFHPAEKVHEPWIEHNEGQIMGGLGYLDEFAAKAGQGWLGGGERIGQADISAVVALGFANRVRPKLEVLNKFPNLAELAARCEGMEEFSSVTP